MTHARKFRSEEREIRHARRVKTDVSLVRDGTDYEAGTPAGHQLMNDLERAVQAGDHIAADGKIPVGYTILGATLFSGLCWVGLAAIIHAIR